jgi:hypothetical protein
MDILKGFKLFVLLCVCLLSFSLLVGELSSAEPCIKVLVLRLQTWS